MNIHEGKVKNSNEIFCLQYFYSIKHISIGGQCDCHGHAESCNYLDPFRPNRLICDCQHNTDGDQCERCDADRGFVQKKWEPARADRYFECERKSLSYTGMGIFMRILATSRALE